MKKQGIVIRHLDPMRPAILCIIPEPEDYECSDNYFVEEAEAKIAEFKKKFVEFTHAKFYLEILDRYGIPMNSRELTD